MTKPVKSRRESPGSQLKTRPKARKAPKKARRSATMPRPDGPGTKVTKQAVLIDLLRRPDGATIAQLTAEMGWQPHSVRGAISGTLKKKLGLAVTSRKVEGRGRVYQIVKAS